MENQDSEVEHLINLALAGDGDCWRSLLCHHEERLMRLVALRLDRRLKGRLDEGDILQEIYLEAWIHLPHYQSNTSHLPFYVWLSGLARNKILELHRFHLGTQKRDTHREVTNWHVGFAESTSAMIVDSLMTDERSPSSHCALTELVVTVRIALESMDAIDREILVLRHFEQLSPTETALSLGIHEKAAAMRYVRAIRRLRKLLSALPGGSSQFRI